MRSIALAYAMMLIVPGSSLLIVVQAGLATQRSHGVWTALGVATGASLLATMLAFSATYFLISSAVVEVGRLVCILVLLLAGIRALNSRHSQADTILGRSGAIGLVPFGMGLATAMANPISLAFFASSALSLPRPADVASLASLPLLVFVMAFSWYGSVGFLLAKPHFSAVHRRIFRSFSIGSGLALVLLACAMAISIRPI
ncbi:hypothetical protein VW35_14635 [Devosia soli]|uniref:Lysine transporter LysE n=1 Tax=Devosia soli TaxID=361041 RepID=A0A0F5L8B8_9HYPH|nr:LysE family transporter [Devosia soli]KKB77877.1 hypothetical protein VW35_14635 [Devosia soli]